MSKPKPLWTMRIKTWLNRVVQKEPKRNGADNSKIDLEKLIRSIGDQALQQVVKAVGSFTSSKQATSVALNLFYLSKQE
jgi:hypothetical protein